jgi:hypothetical protein
MGKREAAAMSMVDDFECREFLAITDEANLAQARRGL